MSTFRYPTKRRYPKQKNRKYGCRNGFEEKTGDQLTSAGMLFGYETLVIPFIQPVANRKYHPDFILENGIIVETKGQFDSADRKKMLLVKAQHPKLDIRMVFSNAGKKI